MRNVTAVQHLERHLNLQPEFGLAQFLAADEENKLLYIGGSGLYIACISSDDLRVGGGDPHALRGDGHVHKSDGNN